MADLYHFFILRTPGATRENVEAILATAPDWYRYHDNCYVVETKQTPEQWETHLQAVIRPNGYLFICKLDKANYFGFMPQSFWKWYQAKIPRR